jgi:formylmethanofuran dehydrogenase subunit E-like metal-binding protein
MVISLHNLIFTFPQTSAFYFHIVFNYNQSELFQALCYKAEGLGFYSFQPHYGPGVDSAYNRNKYQEHSWRKGRPTRKADKFTVIGKPTV